MAKNRDMNNTPTSTEEQVRSTLRRRMARKRVKRIVIWIIVIAIILGGYYLYDFYKKNSRLPWMPEKAAVSMYTTEEAKVYESTYNTTIDLSGYVAPFDEQKVKFRSTGAITGVYVKAGQAVKKGDLLVTINDTSQQYALANLESQIEQAQIEGSARALELLELQKKAAENNLDYTRSYANFDGVVASVDVSVGDYFEAGSSAMTVIDRSKLKATVEIDEIDMQYVKLGQKAMLTFDSLPGQTVEAVVTYIPMIGRYTTQGIGVMDVKITIDDPPAGLAPGYTFEGRIDIEGEISMVLVPQSAVITRRGTSTVEKKMSDGSTQTVTVSVKYLGEGLCQVLGGTLKVGDTVIVKKSTLPSDSVSNMMVTMDAPASDGPGPR
ncbi:MAG: efflux RND transporter periplasmic adaptor subunit [Sphaerochaetaceae bacterium]|nr:efflux RND transporter periplasmic adaptor subunit [Sphaerochaetaceae bacterium]